MRTTILLLTFSNIFMTFAWYAHLRHLSDKPIWVAILLSWGIAFFEYALHVPANRIGHGDLSLLELKIIQEAIAMIVFSIFASFYMNVPITKNYIYASCCLLMAIFFIFRDQG